MISLCKQWPFYMQEVAGLRLLLENYNMIKFTRPAGTLHTVREEAEVKIV